MERINIKNKEVVFNEGAILQKIRFTIENGKESQEQELEVYDHGNAVAALLYNLKGRKFILTRQFRLPTYLNGNPSGFLIEACAGIIEKGESAETTIKREILEETGYQVDEVEKVSEAYSSAGVLTELLHLFLAPYHPGQKQEKGGGLKEEGENIELIELDFEKAASMLKKGEIKDAKTILLLQYFLFEKLPVLNE